MLQYGGRRRPDMAEGCREKLDLEFIAWVWNYRKSSRARAFAEIEKLNNQRVVILKNRKEVAEFLRTAVQECS